MIAEATHRRGQPPAGGYDPSCWLGWRSHCADGKPIDRDNWVSRPGTARIPRYRLAVRSRKIYQRAGRERADVALKRVVSIGAYGFTADHFFAALRDAGVDTLLDIRQRRGVRGAEYAFANHGRLTAALEAVGIRYLHERGLAPTTEIRTAQYAVDAAEGVSKRQRETLSPAFIEAYTREILAPFDLRAMLDAL